MASYNIVSSSYLILTDQTGSTLTTSGHVSGSKYYVLIAPQYATGGVTIRLTNVTGGSADYLRVYNDIPSKYTASFQYTGTSPSGQLLTAWQGTSTTPSFYTANSGKAYIQWAPASSTSSFTIQWTGSGFQTPDLTSSVSNRYALTFPKTAAAAGSYLTFARGRFTGSALTTNADIIFGTWLKPNAFAQTPSSEVYGIFSLGVSPDATHTPGIVFYKPANSQDLKVNAIDSANTATTTLNMSSAMDGGGGTLATQYIPQWHHYGFVIKRPTSTSMVIRGYKDGQLFNTGTLVTGLTAGGNFAVTSDMVLGNFRGSTGVISQGNNFSGSIDDAFLITITTGSTDAQFNSFFADIYNSGSWKNPTLATGSLSSSLNPKVQFAWRFEETGSALSTQDYGTYGNIHSASSQVTGAGDMTFTPTVTGYSYTAYPNLSYALATPSNATVAFTSSVGSVYENTASFYIGVQAVTAAVAQSAIAAIQLSSSTNTASIGTDYTLTYNGTTYSSSAQLPVYITWSASDTSVKYITASIFDNTTYNVNGSSSVFLKIEQGSSTNVTAGSPFLFELKILDYEPGYATLSSSSYSANESDGTASFRVGVNRISGSNGPLSVNYSTADFTALSGTNYTKTTGTLTWADGDSAIKYTSYIPILYDGIFPQNNPVFQINLSNLSTGSFGVNAITSSYVTIVDQEPGTFNWSVTSLTAYETGTLATVSVNRISGTYGSVTVNVSGSSSLGQTLRTTMTGALSFGNGVSSQQFTINIQDDLIDQSNDIIYYRLYPTSSVSGATAFTGSSGLLAFTLIDNETGSVSFNTGSYTLYENTSSYVFNIQRLYGGDQAETASISYTGTATENTQYNVIYNGVTQSSPFTITWADQEKDTRYITASIYDNHVLDGDRNVLFSINSSSISAIGPTSSFQLNILDYEITGAVRFVTSSYSTIIPSPVTIQVERYNGQDISATAVISVSGGTAVADVDYTNIFPYTVTWADQESGSKNIVITPLASWGGNKTLDLKFSSLTNLSSGTILTSSLTFVNSTVFTQSSHQYSDYGLDFTINKYLNLSNDFTRKTQQVPFSLGTNPLVRLKQAYSSST